ncbi:MAG: response regulator [bacterium]|nr:response regulator [bacterium]
MTFAISPYNKQKILIVDDDRYTRLTLEDVLQREGFNTFGLPDGNQVAEIVMNELIDLVLLDLNLPDRDGIEVLREIRYMWSQLPVIMITASRAPDLFHALMELNVFSLLPKPIDIALLRHAVRHALFKL